MKKTVLLLFLLNTFISFAQIQLGGDINGVSGDLSGTSVSLSSDGSIVAIGAPDNSENGSDSGMVRIYKNESGTWTQLGGAINGVSGDLLGTSVSLSSDGSIVAIGAPSDFEDGVNNAIVRLYKYKNESDTWTQLGGDIYSLQVDAGSGTSVSLSSDGSIVAIGAPFNNYYGDKNGYVSIYKNESETWTQIGTAIFGEAGDQLGYSVSLSSDGSIVAVGAPFNDGNGANSGAVRLYKNESGTWTQIGANIYGAAGDLLGFAVSLSSDGSIVATGTSNSDINGYNSGSVRLYKNESDTWTQIGATINGEAVGDRSGWSVSLSSDGSIVAIGAPSNSENGVGSGMVRMYQNDSGTWTQRGAAILGDSANDLLGFAVSLSSDGSIVAIGAPSNSTNEANSGYVSVFDFSAEVLSLEANFIAQQFSIYPNPASETLNLTLNTGLEIEKVKIYNTLGQPVLESEVKNINISSLSTGVYYVEITTNQGKGVKKLMVN